MSSASNVEDLDRDTPSERFVRPGDPSLQNTPQVIANNRSSTTVTKTSDPRRASIVQPPSNQLYNKRDRNQQQSSSRWSTPRKHSSWLPGWLSSVTQTDQVEPEIERLLQRQEDDINRLENLLHEKDDAFKSLSANHVSDQARQQQEFEDEWQSRHRKIEQYYQKTESQNKSTIQNLQVQVEKLESHQNKIQDKYDLLIRQQQEESFKRMKTGRWLPREQSQIKADFERSRAQMKAWAKIAAVKNLLTVQNVEEELYASFLTSLSDVVVFENNQVPRGLSTPKGPSLLLNALLAHDVYTCFFQDPFFCVNNIVGPNVDPGQAGYGFDEALDKIYSFAIGSNEEDAHVWRSQTLRLLLPQVRADNTAGEKDLHQWTEERIAKMAELCASQFTTGSARYLIDTKTANMKKLSSIYQEAALTSYMLWTQKTAMRLVTLRDMEGLTFDVDNSRLKPHSLVHPDDHDDKLKGRPITLVVGPLLQVYGTDEGKDYGNARVWVPAEVWFDTK